ncbi:unnamed protein product [Arctogadus glacialis]
MGLIQNESDDTAQVWNTRTIRPSKNLNIPSSRPNVMFALPELYGTRDFLSPIENGSEGGVTLVRPPPCVFEEANPDLMTSGDLTDLLVLCCTPDAD